MSFNKSSLITVLLLIGKVSTQYKRCDYYQRLTVGATYSIASPEYSRNYNRGAECRWAAEAPSGYKVALNCNDVKLPSVLSCRSDKILVSRSGKASLSDGKVHCGVASFTENSISTRMVVALKTGSLSKGGSFKCSFKAVASKCSCGQLNRGKIVGGSQTKINEYPSMAGVVDAKERRVFCGATIISSTHALSAAHCGIGRSTSSLGLLLGEHDTSKGSESPYTVLLKIAEFISHPSFNRETNAHDIALIRPQNAMKFSRGIQPACLPYKYRNESFLNRAVQALGWGQTQFAGAQSDVLKQVTLSVVNSGNCTSKQMCSFARSSDTCQGDSGGPLLFVDNNVIFLIGVVSYGIGCASNQPSVNTRVTSYLDWIQMNTQSTTYCVR